MFGSRPNHSRLTTSECAILAAILCAVLAVIWGVAYGEIQRVDRAAYRASLAEVEHDTNQLALEWEAKLAYVESLQIRAREITRMVLAKNPAAQDRIDELKANLHLAGQDFELVSGFDPAGKVIWSTNERVGPDFNVADRGYFHALAAQGQNQLIGNPILARVNNIWSIPFASATRAEDGHLLSVTLVAMRADLIKTMTRFLDPKFQVTLALIRDDSQVLAREPPKGIGERTDDRRQLISQTRATGFTSGLHPSSIDGIRRFYAFRTIPGAPLLVTAAIDEDVAMTTARERAESTFWWSILLSAISAVLLISWALAFQYRRISQARQAQLQRALDHEALLTRFAAKATDMIALFDQDLKYIFINAAFEKTLGYSAASLLGHRAGESANPSHRELLKSELAILVTERKARRIVSQVQTARGELLWLDSEFVAIDDENGTGPGVAHYMATTRDVTQQMSDRAELMRTQEHVRTLLQMGSGVLGSTLVDMTGKKLQVTISPLSPNYTQMMAAAAHGDEVSLKGRVLAKDAPRLQEAYRRCIAEGHAVVEVSALAEDGSVHQRRAQLVLAERHAEDCDIVVYASDVTEEYATRRRMELAERLATLGEVTAHLAHELNQPVASILMSAENGIRKLERAPSDTADALGRLDRIKLMAIRMGEIIQNVRRFGRSDIGVRQPFDIGALLMEAEVLTASRLAAAKTSLVINCETELPVLNVPRLSLAQVVINLLANACDAYEAKPEILSAQRVIVINASATGHRVQLTVADAAGGIPGEIIDQVFDSFFTTKSSDKGTGLGLSISRSLMREMGGDITVHNANGGAVFTVTLPAATQPQQTDAA